MCVPTKDGTTEWGCREFGCVGYYGNIKGEKEDTPARDNTYQIKLHMTLT